MKRIDENLGQCISDLIFEQGLRIAEFALEKDFIITDVLSEASKINHPVFELVFCGGTCLSKAYGLLDRISEDVDIKVIQRQPTPMSQGQVRSAMRSLKADIRNALIATGFREEDIVDSARDQNTYVVFDARYHSHFSPAEGMRGNMKLELNFASLALPIIPMEVGFLFDQMSSAKNPVTVALPCVDVREALAEKLIAFPRRLAMHLNDQTRPLDNTLVRHLYDVHEFVTRIPDSVSDLALLKKLVQGAMTQDATDFATQHPQYVADPIGQINQAMAFAIENTEVMRMYDRFIQVMVYGENPPSFDQAFSCFKSTLDSVLA